MLTRPEHGGDYFTVQLTLADVVAERGNLSRGDATLRYTNLHQRFGLGRAVDRPAAGWVAYARELEALSSFGDRLRWTLDFLDRSPPEAEKPNRFGCFRFDPPDAAGNLRLHFSNQDVSGGTGPLAREKTGVRRRELSAMFSHIREKHPSAREVVGGSWLYNIEAYCRLFPQDYIASRHRPDVVRMDGTSTWGQLLDHHNAVKPEMRAALTERLSTLDPSAPWRSFPLHALRTQAPVEVFYALYDIG